MRRAIAMGAALLALGGCGQKMIDPCAGEPGACLAVQIAPSPSVEKLDAVTVHVTGDDGLDATRSTGAHGAVSLPAAVALAFGTLDHAVSLHVEVTATLGGNVVGGGAGSGALSGRAHASLAITVTADGTPAPAADLGVGDGDDDGGDDGAVDLGPPSCGSGTHLCNGACADDTSVDTCGSACTPCPVGANAAAATCDGTTCGLQCTSGHHLCGGACVSDSSVESCNQSCTPCTAPVGGTATCDGMSCGGACPNGQKLCVGACIPTNMACNGSCPSGTHDCNGNCFDDGSVNSCGTSCTPCPVPANATNATCMGGVCDFVCDSGYKKCGSACIPSTGCCTNVDCAQPANGSASCGSDHTCHVTCDSNYTDCSGTCKPITSVSSCGPSCLTCTAPAHATPTCNGTACDFTCDSGYVRSGNACVACGAAGQTCCASNTCNARLVCQSGACQQKMLTWTTPPNGSGTVSSLNAVWVSPSGARYVVGFNETILQSTDGSTWTAKTSPLGTSGSLLNVWGSTVTGSVYASDTSSNVIESAGGAWSKIVPAPPSTDDLQGLWGDTSGKIFVGTGGGQILTFTPQTDSWATLNTSPAMSYVRNLWGSSKTSDIYAVGTWPGSDVTAGVAHSKDGGKTWSAYQIQPTLTELMAVWGTAAGDVYAVGTGGVILHATVGSDSWTAQTPTAAGGQTLYGIWGSDQSGYLYTVGANGLILHSIGDGKWTKETSNTTTYLFGVWGNPAGTEVYAVGDQGLILRGQ